MIFLKIMVKTTTIYRQHNIDDDPDYTSQPGRQEGA